MNYKKYIYPTKLEGGKWNVLVHVLVGYCPQTWPYYSKMIAELQKTFPEADMRDIKLSKVIKSSRVQGFTLIRWWGQLEWLLQRNLDGWYVWDNDHVEYFAA